MPQSLFGDDGPRQTGKSPVAKIVIGLLIVLVVIGYFLLKK